jgi:hypothetical protein
MSACHMAGHYGDARADVRVVLSLVAIVRTAWTWPAAPALVGRRESLA